MLLLLLAVGAFLVLKKPTAPVDYSRNMGPELNPPTPDPNQWQASWQSGAAASGPMVTISSNATLPSSAPASVAPGSTVGAGTMPAYKPPPLPLPPPPLPTTRMTLVGGVPLTKGLL